MPLLCNLRTSTRTQHLLGEQDVPISFFFIEDSTFFKKSSTHRYCGSNYYKKAQDKVITYTVCIVFQYQFTVHIIMYVIFMFSGTVSQPKIQLFYYKANSFQHFDYIYKLTRDCKLRNFRGIHCNCIETTPMPKDVILEIGIVGDFTEENLRFITKSKGALLH